MCGRESLGDGMRGHVGEADRKKERKQGRERWREIESAREKERSNLIRLITDSVMISSKLSK